MKSSKSQNYAGGQLRNGIFKEFFKDGTLSCAGRYRNGEDRRVEVLSAQRTAEGHR